MTEKATKRSGMLGTIYKMLPNIDDDYAAKLVYTLENKKSVSRLQQDIADISAQLGDGGEMADTIVAKILLDEITLPAALRQLRVYNNAVSVAELTNALDARPLRKMFFKAHGPRGGVHGQQRRRDFDRQMVAVGGLVNGCFILTQDFFVLRQILLRPGDQFVQGVLGLVGIGHILKSRPRTRKTLR